MTEKTNSIETASGFINIAPGPTEELSYFSLGDKNHAYLTKEEISELTDSLYAAQELEVIPLRDELLAFLEWLNGAKFWIDERNVDEYLEQFEPQTPADDGEFL